MVKKTLNFIKMSLFENFCERFHFAASSACQQHRETDKERESEGGKRDRQTDKQTEDSERVRERERELHKRNKSFNGFI